MFKHWTNERRRPTEEAAIAALQGSGAALIDVSNLLRLMETHDIVGRQRIARLAERGILTRVRTGLYRFNDPARPAPPPVLPAELLRASSSEPLVLGYETAMAAHGLGTLSRPMRLKAFSTTATKPRALGGGWVLVPFPADLDRDFDELEVPGFGKAQVTTAEETILDALDFPRRTAGGVLLVARFIGHMRGKLDVAWLVERALTSRAFPMVHRLGMLLEMSGQAQPAQLSHLREYLRDQYRVLEPAAPRSPERLKYWMLEVNVPYAEVAGALGVAWPPRQ